MPQLMHMEIDVGTEIWGKMKMFRRRFREPCCTMCNVILPPFLILRNLQSRSSLLFNVDLPPAPEMSMYWAGSQESLEKSTRTTRMWITESLFHFQTGHWSYTANNRWKQYSDIDLSDPEPVSHLNSWYLDFSLVSITEVFSSVLSSLEWGEKPLVLSSGRGRRDA